jgi:hypothetical protein
MVKSIAVRFLHSDKSWMSKAHLWMDWSIHYVLYNRWELITRVNKYFIQFLCVSFISSQSNSLCEMLSNTFHSNVSDFFLSINIFHSTIHTSQPLLLSHTYHHSTVDNRCFWKCIRMLHFASWPYTNARSSVAYEYETDFSNYMQTWRNV